MKSAVRFLALLTVLCLFGGVANWAAQDRRPAQAPLKGNKSTTRSDAISLGGQVDVQKQEPERSSAPSTGSQSSSVGIREPPFLKHPVLFGPNSLELNPGSRNTLKRAASWLREHREARILIVGFCDRLGSETCTHTLAEERGSVVRQFLMRLGIESDQIVGVKGWDNVDQDCRTAIAKCQRLNRSAQIFMASSPTALK